MDDSKQTTAPTMAKPRDSGSVMWEETAPVSEAPGAAVIADLVTRLPKKPGVYRMLNTAGDVLYVGKAKNL
ncbi:MAG: excinuclease ABC subunit C, partial [Pseudomonadota bacterium]